MRTFLISFMLSIVATTNSVRNCAKVADAKASATEILKKHSLETLKPTATLTSPHFSLDSFTIFGEKSKIAYLLKYDISKSEVVELLESQAEFLANLKENGLEDDLHCFYDSAHGYTVSVLAKGLPSFQPFEPYYFRLNLLNHINVIYNSIRKERKRLANGKGAYLLDLQQKKLLIENIDYFRYLIFTYLRYKPEIGAKDKSALSKLLAELDGFYSQIKESKSAIELLENLYDLFEAAEIEYPQIPIFDADEMNENDSEPPTVSPNAVPAEPILATCEPPIGAVKAANNTNSTSVPKNVSVAKSSKRLLKAIQSTLLI